MRGRPVKFDDSVPGVMFIILAVFLLNRLLTFSAGDVADTGDVVESRPVAEVTEPVVEVDLERIRRSLAPARMLRNDAIDRYRHEVEALVESGDTLAARAVLIDRAAEANESGDRRTLGYILALLGEVSFESRDFGAAQIYLDEALGHFTAIGDSIGEAYAYMQFGRMHIKSRAIARHAGEAYNLMLLARYQLSHFQYDAAETNLARVIDASLAIDRFGTAAGALTSLSRVIRETGRTHEAEQALSRAAELHAASGREFKARELLEELLAQGVDPYLVDQRRAAVDRALTRFHEDTRQVLQARDYRSLFYQYRNAGNDRQAWTFRIKAADMLAQTSKRAMYYRQPDVMAILYNSNFAMASAHRYVEQARSIYRAEGEQELAERAGDLSTSIH